MATTTATSTSRHIRPPKVPGLSAGMILTATLAGVFPLLFVNLSSPRLTYFIGDFPIPDYPFASPFRLFSSNNNDLNTNTSLSQSQNTSPPSFTCDTAHTYKTELVSLDPLIIYIQNLISPTEIVALLTTAEPLFTPSVVTKGGRADVKTQARTSSSAGLPREDPAVQCVLKRARAFMGTMMRDGWDEMGPPQLVRYRAGERFNVHHDWFNSPVWASADGSDNRRWNRVASFFAILQDNCTGGETHFPFARPAIVPPSPKGEESWRGGGHEEVVDHQAVKNITDGETVAVSSRPEKKPLWREHEDGGLAFRPVAGNALFWVNLRPDGTGDERTNHAGLPLVDGLKTAMNIWPRQYYAYD